MPLNDILFSPLTLRNITLPNRLVRSATYEGLGLPDGTPRPELADLYSRIATADAGTIITGFCFVSQEGRAMQPGQCGCDTDAKAQVWQALVHRVKAAAPTVKLIMQWAHTGRQTRRVSTGHPVVGASSRRCRYFRGKVHPLTADGITRIIGDFASAARRAQQAGFDGVQLHAAHGYLIHQFLSPYTNTRSDFWGVGTRLLAAIVQATKEACGATFPLFAKFSAADERGMTVDQTTRQIQSVEAQLDAVEISYGTMEFGLNIIRGGCPLERAFEVNPLLRPVPRVLRGIFRRLFLSDILSRQIPFEENYNLESAAHISQHVQVPVLAVGGFRRAAALRSALTEHRMAAVSLCRPFICEPDLTRKLRLNDDWESTCTSCNLCTINCDAAQSVCCARTTRRAHHEQSPL